MFAHLSGVEWAVDRDSIWKLPDWDGLSDKAALKAF